MKRRLALHCSAQDLDLGGFLRLVFTIVSVLGYLFLATVAFSMKAGSCVGAESRLLAATKALDQDNFHEAERLFLDVQVSHKQCSDVLLGLGRIYTASGDLGAAYNLLSRYTKLVPEDHQGYFHLARYHLSRGDTKTAETELERAISLNPDSAAPLILLGQVQWKEGLLTKAEETLEKACKAAPDSVDAHFQLGTLLDTMKRHSKAVEQFRKVVALDPHNPRAYDFLALNLEPIGNSEGAEKAYKQGLRVNSGPLFDAFLDYNYGRFLMKMDRLTESKRHLDRALKLAPKIRAVHYEHAKLYMRLGMYEAARTDAERALILSDPSGFILDLQVYYLLSRVYTRLGEEELARKYHQLSRTAKIPIQSRERK